MFGKPTKGLSLRNFLQTQNDVQTDVADVATEVEEESETTEADDDETADNSAESETDDPVTSAPEEVEGATAEAVEPTAPMASVPAAELEQLRRDAAAWNQNRAQFETLQTWYQKQTGGTPLPAGDASDRQATAKRSWEQAPWNQ